MPAKNTMESDLPPATTGARWQPPPDWQIPAIPAIQAILTRVERNPVARCASCDAELGVDDGKICRVCEERQARRAARRGASRAQS